MSKTPKAKFKLGETPEFFPEVTAAFKSASGNDAEIKAVFIYRDREQFGEFVGKHFKTDAAEFPRTEDGGIDFAAMARKSTSSDAAYLKEAVKSWDLDDELTLDALKELAKKHPAAVVALKAAYAAACNEGRLGN